MVVVGPLARPHGGRRDPVALPAILLRVPRATASQWAPEFACDKPLLAILQQAAGRGTAWLGLPPRATSRKALALLRGRMPQCVGVPVATT